MARPSFFRFTGPCVTEPALDVDPSGRTKRILQAFRLEGPYGLKVNVPRGFLTDFASTPRFLWPFYPPDGPWQQAAVVHDVLYREGEWNRAMSDSLFLRAMELLPVPAYRRWIFYLVLRLAGGAAWRENARKRRP